MRSVSVLIGELDALAKEIKGSGAELCEEVAESLSELEGRYLDAEEEIDALGDEISYLEADDGYAQSLYCAIVERRMEDAISILRKVFPGESFVDSKTYQRLFPERIE